MRLISRQPLARNLFSSGKTGQVIGIDLGTTNSCVALM